MNQTKQNVNLLPVSIPEAEVVRDPATIEASYQNDVYDPRRDVRNQYPWIAQQMLFNPVYREQLIQIAKDICTSGMYGYKDSPQGNAAVRMVAMKGFAMGMDMLKSLEVIKVIHGTPTIRGPKALDLIRERTRNATLDCTESTSTTCTWLLGRPGEQPKAFTKSRDQVDRAKLAEKNPLWNTYPERMLKWHTFSEGAQELFGDVLSGCYITEEMDLRLKFDQDVDDVVKQQEKERGDKFSSPPRRQAVSPPREEQRSPPHEEQRSPNHQSSPSLITQEQRKKLGELLAELVIAEGGQRPSEWMSESEKSEAQGHWDHMKSRAWESVSKNALGKIVKSKDLTSDEFLLLVTALINAIDAARAARETDVDVDMPSSG
jgi:hypothetical protein